MKKLNALVIRPDATFTLAPIDANLHGLQGLVGGWIEAVTPDSETTMFINEESKLNGSEFNPLATSLWWELDPRMAHLDGLWGTVVVLGPVDANGDETAISDDTIKTFATIMFAAFEAIYGEEPVNG